jgi:hypothetical protein
MIAGDMSTISASSARRFMPNMRFSSDSIVRSLEKKAAFFFRGVTAAGWPIVT